MYGLGAAGVGQQLLDEERVALATREDRVGHPARRLAAGDCTDLLRHISAVQTPELDPLGPARPLQFGHERPQRMPPVELVRSVRRNHHEPVAAGVVDDKGQQVARRWVDPMDILDDQQHGLSGGQPREYAIYGLKQLLPRAVPARLRSTHGPQRAQRRTHRGIEPCEHLRIQHH
jgi:hypothetical protein